MSGYVLAFDDRTAALVRETLRTALYSRLPPTGGFWPEGGRQALRAIIRDLRPEDSDEVDYDELVNERDQAVRLADALIGEVFREGDRG